MELLNTKKIKILLLGASFNTGNLGVSALSESAIKCILRYWNNAEIRLLGALRKKNIHKLTIGKQHLEIPNIPLHFSKKIFLPNHFIVLFFCAVIFKIIPSRRLKNFCFKNNPYLSEINNSYLVVDISGGDSFSDIYGMKRFVFEFLKKWLMILLKKPLVLLPQTYGPFKRTIVHLLARHILKRSVALFSRDQDGIETLKKILTNDLFNKNVHLVPDVAFILDKRKPGNWNLDKFSKNIRSRSVIIGLNMSGLLFNGGYTGSNMFNLNIDYQELIYSIIEFFMNKQHTIIFLIPHVIPSDEFKRESDPEACKQVYNKMQGAYKNRIINIEGDYDQNEIKYIIGNTHFFIGARMHSCIAALSQCIPTVGMAYSKKFHGVFRTAGVAEHVADMRTLNKDSIIAVIEECFRQRNKIAKHLTKIVPKMKQQVLNIFVGLKI